MASIARDKNGTRRICFLHPGDKKRKTIRLGKTSIKVVETTRFRCEQLIEHQSTGWPMSADLCQWVCSLAPDMRDKFVRVGLIEPLAEENSIRLGQHIADVLAQKSATYKTGTRLNWQATTSAMLAYFGDTELRGITPAACEQWRRSMLASGLREPTVHKHVQRARAAFEAAKTQGQIDSNPFATVKQRVGIVNARQAYVPMDTFWRVLQHAPNDTWRVLMVLSRIQGLRTPSEPFSLRWRDITWPDASGRGGSILVFSPKGEHNATKAQRRMPLFPEAVPFLRALQTTSQTEWVIPEDLRSRASNESGWRGCNLRSQLVRIIQDSFNEPWPKPWHNLRASCETDLLRLTGNVVQICGWLGNSTSVAIKHYISPEHLGKFDTHDWFGDSKAAREAAREAAQ